MSEVDSKAAAMAALELTDSWPVGSVAAAVVAVDPGSGVVTTLAERGDQNEVFELASVTKLLTAAAALMAVEEGAIEFDEAAGPVGSTVRHLLAHASGLDFGDRRVRCAPGERRIYSSAGYEVLAEHLEDATGIAFPEYLSAGVGESLGMGATVLDGSAGHGARSSVADLQSLAGEMLSPHVLDASTWEAASTVWWPELNGVVPGYGMQRPCPWGLGPEIKGEKRPHWTGARNSARTFGHFGQAGTFLWVDPEARGRAAAGASLIVLTDRAFGDWAKPLWPELSDAVVEALET